MNIVYSPAAQKSIENLDEEIKNKIRDKIEDLKKDPTGHSNSKLIQIGDREIYRLEVKKTRNSKIDHRVIYDIQAGKIRIYTIFNRDHGYQNLEDKF